MTSKNTQWWLPSNTTRIEPGRKKYNVQELEERIAILQTCEEPQHILGRAQLRHDYTMALRQKTKRQKMCVPRKNLDVDTVFERIVEALLTIPVQNPNVGLESLANHLNVKSHVVRHALMRANREGWCQKVTNSGAHDTHRDYLGWGGPWVSSWRPTIFMIRTDILRATHGNTLASTPSPSP